MSIEPNTWRGLRRLRATLKDASACAKRIIDESNSLVARLRAAEDHWAALEELVEELVTRQRQQLEAAGIVADETGELSK